MAIIVDSLFTLDIAGYLKFSSYQVISVRVCFMQNIRSHLIFNFRYSKNCFFSSLLVTINKLEK